MQLKRLKNYLFILFFIKGLTCSAQQDTLRVMAYNVLHYGDGCQGSNAYLHSLLKTVVQYASPDILGLVKVQSIQVTPSDHNGISPYGFADTIIKYALNSAFPGRYNYCPLTNIAASSDMDILFYNQNKLGFVSLTTLCSIQEDFDLYKLYYKDPYLSVTHDSTFLYIILNHTVSGSASAQRDQQDTINIGQLKKIFYHLPNLISIGDFNTRTSGELGYQAYVNNSDTGFIFDDPPFNPDHLLSYPIDWHTNPYLCSAELNTSTRLSSSYPNSCGASGGGKDWYEHIFLSRWIISNTDFIKYVSKSYTTLGNNGNRIGISENDSTTSGKNTSAPSNVINAIFNLSDKYPVLAKLLVTYDSLGNGPSNPVNSMASVNPEQEKIKINNPVKNNLEIYFPNSMIGKKYKMDCLDIYGRTIFSQELTATSSIISRNINLSSGCYILRLENEQGIQVLRFINL